jgi:hypothetical protein
MLPANLPSHSFHPKRLHQSFNSWLGHLPFARDLIGSLRPSILVELGTHYGESYFGFCQSVAESSVRCTCYGVDTWEADGEAGFYGDEAFMDVQEYNHKNYASFSTLLRMTFDQAVTQFQDGSLDILHIDGLHTYDAVAHDFKVWFPKLRPGGTMLLHDVEVRRGGFQVWRLWQELRTEFPTFTFTHHSGLGLLQKPGASRDGDDLLTELLQAGQEKQEEVRRYYVSCAKWLVRLAEEATRRRTLQELLTDKEKRLTDGDVRLQEKTSQAAHYRNLLGEMEQKFLDAENRLNERTSEGRHLRNLLTDLEQKLLDTNHRLNEKTSEGQHLRNLLTDLEQKLLDTNHRLNEREQKFLDAETRLNEKSSEGQHLRNLLAEMEQKFLDAENRLSQTASERQHYINLLSEKTFEAEHLKRLLDELASSIPALKEQLASEEAQHVLTTRELSMLKVKLSRLPLRLLVR